MVRSVCVCVWEGGSCHSVSQTWCLGVGLVQMPPSPPRCHHCHSFLPTFTEVACKLRQHNIQLGKLDIENAKETKNRCLSLSSLPSSLHLSISPAVSPPPTSISFPLVAVSQLIASYFSLLLIPYRYEISEVPALKIFMKGLIYPYEGPTDVQGVCMLVPFRLLSFCLILFRLPCKIMDVNID